MAPLGKALSASSHIGHASSVQAHLQLSSHQSEKSTNVHAKFREPQTSDLLVIGVDDDGDDEDVDEDYKPPEDEDDDTETDYSIREGDFDLGYVEEREGEEGPGEESEDGDEAEDEEDESECESGDEDEDENKGVEVEGSEEKVENNHEDNASVRASLWNDIEAANANFARSLPVSPRPGYSNAPQAKSKERLPPSSVRGTPSLRPPCAPSQSQPFPLPSYEPMTPLDPSIDLSSTCDWSLQEDSIESSHSLKEDDLRPAKRSKLELAASVPHKHEQFWLLDGNTVVEVGGVLFRLHRSRLVDQSTFFARLLNEQDVVMDDCVVVEGDEHGIVYHLSNVTSTDFEALLQLDRNPMVYYFVPPTFRVLAAILRAATELRFNAYRAFAVKILENAWSSSLADLTTETKSNAVEVVILASACGIKSVLKRAFYEMVRVTGYGLGDGELDSDGDDGEVSREITRADERRLERMRERLISTWSQVAVRMDRSFKCPNQSKETPGISMSPSTSRLPGCPSLCWKQDAWERRVHDSGLYEEYQFDPLCGLQALIDIKWDTEEGWCSDCVRAKREAWTRMRKKTWELIDVWMDLDN